MFKVGDRVRVKDGSSHLESDKIRRVYLSKNGDVLCELHHHWDIYPSTSLELVSASDHTETQLHNVGDIVQLKNGDDTTYRIITVQTFTPATGAPELLYRIYATDDVERKHRKTVKAKDITSVTYSLF